MAFELSDEVFKRGMLTRKATKEVIEKTLKRWSESTVRSFDFYREQIERFANAKRKAQRGEVIVTLDAIGWNGIFRADDIARILLNTDNRTEAKFRAMAKLDMAEVKYKDSKRKAAVIRRGISCVIPKGWRRELEVSADSVSVRFLPNAKANFGGVLVEGADNIYAFLQMVLIVRPMLFGANIRFNFDTFQTLHSVWSMGESTYCYSYPIETSGAEVLEKERKSYRDYFADYDLPDHIKATILDILRQNISSIQCGVYYSPEDGSYNSIKYKPIPDKGVWCGAGKRARLKKECP